ncbi:MAG: flagellar basal body P-ring formation protein FlgA [Deltaproteobacteria bacterium]|nr:flagellar basal body P-ring formation protein FlgA [Deltaproteobacteria bacterium]MBW2129191.1 flagellar basal body P-ring formation protein FlgA [Deltaproteobacteria bacterium]
MGERKEKMMGFIRSFKAIRGAGLFLLLLLFVGLGISPPAWALKIRIKGQVAVRGEKVTLGDIASFEPADDPRWRQLGRIEIASAPAPNGECMLSKRFLEYKIYSAIGRDGEIRLEIPGPVVIKRKGRLISAQKLEEIFKTFVRDHAPWAPEEMTIERIKTPGDLNLPYGRIRWEVRERGNPDYLGNVYLTVGFWVDDKRVRNVALSGRIRVVRKVVKAARRIRKGEKITEADLVLAEEALSSRRGMAFLLRPGDILGKQARRNIPAGQCITGQMIEDPPLVKKGARVMIKAENDFLQVTTIGKVLEDGKAGDRVKVVNLSSGKEIVAIVKGPGLVQVYF